MHVLIFGATGYVGRHVAARFVAAGHRVTGFVRDTAGGDLMANLGAASVTGTIDGLLQSADPFADYDTVLWIAQLLLADERRVVEGMLNVLAGSGKTFLFTGGTSLISEQTDGAWSENSFAEDDIFVPRKQVASRLETEKLVRAANERGVRSICLRPPLIWGNGTCKIIADLYHSARETGAVCYIGSGLNPYSNVHIEDLAELYLLAVEKGVSGALYHSVSGEVNFRMMAETVARHLGVPARSIDFEKAVALWDKFTALLVFASCSRSRSPRARGELGWMPRADRLDLLAECLNPAFAEAGPRTLSSWVRKN